MKRLKNKSIIYNRKKYEIIWISDYALHVCNRYNDPSHKINHVEIEKLLLKSKILTKRNDWYVALGLYANKIYKTIVYLYNKRCIIKTSCICNDVRLIKLYNEQ